MQFESVLVTDLAAMLNVSLVTIRKDLTELEKASKLYRSHGTANAGSIITVTLKDKDAKGTTALRTATGVTDNRGNWTVRLKPLTDTKAEYVLSVDCKDVKATKTNRTNHDEVNDNRYWPGVASWSDQAHPTVVKRLTETIKRKGAPLSRLTFNHVAVGEVWLCSGQSNMGFMLRQSDTGSSDIPKAAFFPFF